jgi:hypothetical protein
MKCACAATNASRHLKKLVAFDLGPTFAAHVRVALKKHVEQGVQRLAH